MKKTWLGQAGRPIEQNGAQYAVFVHCSMFATFYAKNRTIPTAYTTSNLEAQL